MYVYAYRCAYMNLKVCVGIMRNIPIINEDQRLLLFKYLK